MLAYMRKFCLETGLAEPLEKSINETFSHQVNYARRKFKRGKIADGTTGSSSSLHTPTPHSDGPHHPHAPPHQMPLQQHHHHNQDLSGDSFRHHHQQQCSDNNGGPTNPSRLNWPIDPQTVAPPPERKLFVSRWTEWQRMTAEICIRCKLPSKSTWRCRSFCLPCCFLFISPTSLLSCY